MGRMHVRLNGEPLEGMGCFKHLGSQVATEGCGTPNEEAP